MLGLLAADGCLIEANKNQGHRITLSLIDREMIIQFGEAIGWANPTIRRSGLRTWLIVISSKTMFDELCELGVTPRKSLTLDFCHRVPTDLIRHYIRGYFDGDGCASWVKTRVGPRLYLTFAGTFEMLSGIEEYLRGALAIEPKTIYSRPLQRIRILQYTSQREVYAIVNHLYSNAEYFLQRKFNSISGILE